MIEGVGNYGEVFERNVGQGSPLKIERGLNALWSKGGIAVRAPGPLIAGLEWSTERRKPPFPCPRNKPKTGT